MNSCANIPVVCHSGACKFVQSQVSDPGGRAGGTCRCAPHPPPQVLSILRTLASCKSPQNKRHRLGFVDEVVNRNFLTKMSRKSNSSLAAIFASYPSCDPCSISPCENEVFGGSTNTKFNEFLCKYSCRLSFRSLKMHSVPSQQPGRKSWRYVQMRTSSAIAGVSPEDTDLSNLDKTSVITSALSMNWYIVISFVSLILSLYKKTKEWHNTTAKKDTNTEHDWRGRQD